MRTRLVVLVAGLVCSGLVVSCSGGADLTECQDGRDNDGDGRIDDADPACTRGDVEADDPPSGCSDGADNDGDGQIDFPGDPGCDSVLDTDEFNAGMPDCRDGDDNDGDGAIDYPADPGCFNPNQDGEDDDCPDGASCPECGDGLDNDGDGNTDYPADTGCGAASGAIEFMLDANACGVGTIVTELPANGQVAAVLSGTSHVASTTCGGNGPERAYLMTIDRPVTMVASTNSGGTNVNTVLYVRRTCLQGATELACNDDVDTGNNRSTLTVELAPGKYFLVVDGRDVTSVGSFQMSVRFFVGLGEECSGPTDCADGYTCRALPPATVTTCQLPVCRDGRDDDGDGRIDFPLDPGCASPADGDETDPCPGVGCPACADGVDNDTDGQTDYPLDPSCIAASATSEADCPIEVDPVAPITAATTSGTTVGASNEFAPSCQSFSDAPDRVHMLYVRLPLATLVVDTNESPLDTVLSIADATCTLPLACDDDSGQPAGQSRIELTNVAVGAYAVIVDGFFQDEGSYSLHVAGTYDVGAACDPSTPYFTCPAGYGCGGPVGMTTCIPAACNDAVDDDGDGLPGFPTDPGCASTSDIDEADDCPTGPNCPQCANGDDDDGDGDIDYPMDLGCIAASTTSEDCATLDPLRPFVANVTGQTTTGLANDFDLTCSPDGNDEVWRLRLLSPLAELRVNTLGSSLDAVLAIKRAGCATFELQCDDGSLGSGDSEVFLVDVDAGDYFLIIDDQGNSSGSYNLNVTGRYADGAACDPTSTIFTCNPGLTCAGTTPTCVVAACNDTVDGDGDGFVGYPTDPGCATTSDNDETDACPSGPGCPACSDDIDNDLDGFVDYPNDPSCAAASVTSELAACASVDPVIVFSADVADGSLVGRANDVALSCSFFDGGDEVYRVFVTQPLVSLTVDTNGSDSETAIAIREGSCNTGTDLACGWGNTSSFDSSAQITNVAVGEYFILIDDTESTPTTYDLHVRGVLPPGSSCAPTSTSFVCVTGHACAGATPTCVVAACNDAIDADGDGDPGYPTDAGCVDVNDNDESDTCPTGPGCPACSNGADDDLDTRIDYPLDLGCSAASSTSEAECQAETDPLINVAVPTFTGTTTGATDDFAAICGTSFDPMAPDRVHFLNLRVPVASLTVDTIDSTYDTTLSITDPTCGMVIECDDDDGGFATSTITRTDVAAGAYGLIVDGFSAGAGPYTLHVRGTIAAGGSCNDPLVAAGVLTCAIGTTCQANVCAP